MIRTKKHGDKLADSLIQTLRHPTRASIFYQLARKPESTATEISRSLKEDVDIVYYHLKLLRKAGLISKPRVVAQKNYVEKYYSIHPDCKEKFLQSVGEIEVKKKELSTDEFREYLLNAFAIIQSVLVGLARRIEKVDSKNINDIRDKDNTSFKVLFCTEERYNQLLDELREVAKNSIFKTFDPVAKEHIITIIAIPGLGENAN